MKRISVLLFIGLIAILTITGCAHATNVEECLPATEHVYGFWGGTWHGLISVFSFIGSLFDDNIAVYAVNNNGHWYDFGFVGGFFFILRIIAITLKSNNK
jgi:hypothetical protein